MQTIILFSLLALAVAAWAWEIYTREAGLWYNANDNPPPGDRNVQTFLLNYGVTAKCTKVQSIGQPSCRLASAMVSLATSSLV